MQCRTVQYSTVHNSIEQFIISPLATYLLISSTDVFLLGRPEGLLGDGKKDSDKNTAKLAF